MCSKINFPNFDEYFEVAPLEEYHRVILMNDFVQQVSPEIWTESNRIYKFYPIYRSFSLENRKIACYSPRTFGHKSEKIQSCNPFEGSPFKQFWHHIGVRQFPAGSIFYEPLHTDYNYASDWIDKYRNEAVLTFVGKNCQDKVIVC